MPNFFFKNPLGQRERIFPLHFSDLTGFIICETEQAKQLRIHRDCIETVNTLEEQNEARKKYYENLFKQTLHTGESGSGSEVQNQKVSEKVDK